MDMALAGTKGMSAVILFRAAKPGLPGGGK